MVSPLISPPRMAKEWLCSGGFLKSRSVGRPARQNGSYIPFPAETDSAKTTRVAQVAAIGDGKKPEPFCRPEQQIFKRRNGHDGRSGYGAFPPTERARVPTGFELKT